MNINPKEKFARIDIRVKPKDKDKIKQLAGKFNLSVSEYMVQRALGYEPRTVQPDVFFDFYVENDDKTDKRMYVSGINCPKQRAYQCMMATKRRYGKLGGNVAYHGYQSFVSGEVTPEEAHKIGLETAKRMWGDDYEVVVTTHLNTDNIHNHFVINSVSFKTGRKFENHISDHYRLREISDEICRERGKAVLAPSKFIGCRKKDYWIHKNGGLTHRDILKRDIESILPYCGNMDDIERRLVSLGYQFPRNRDYEHISILARRI